MASRELVQTLSDLQNSIDDGENEDAAGGKEDCSVMGNSGVGGGGSPSVTAFNIDHKKCAGVVLSDNETRKVSFRRVERTMGPFLKLNSRPFHFPRFWKRTWHSNFVPRQGTLLYK